MPLKKIGLGSRSEQGRSVSARRPERKEEKMIIFSLGWDCLGREAVLKLNRLCV